MPKVNPLNSTISKVVFLLMLSSCAIAEDRGIAFVSSQNGGVSVIDLNTMAVTTSIKDGISSPRGLGISNNGQLLVTANKETSNISVIDTKTNKLKHQVNIGKNPEFVRIKNNLAYVTYEPSSKSGPPSANTPSDKEDDDDQIPGHIAIVDIVKGKLIRDITGKPETEGLEFTADGKHLIVTNESDNSITVHNLKSGKLIKTISLADYGNRPRGVKVSPDGQHYAVTLELSDKLLILDSDFKVIKDIPTGKAPYGVSYDRSGKHIYVASNKAKQLHVFDASSYEKLKDITTGDRCWHFSFTPDDREILLACGKSNEIVVIDASSLEVTKRIISQDMPWGIVTYPKSVGSLDQP